MLIAFVLTHIPNPRMNKRIAIAKSVGEVVVICVRRASQNIWEPAHRDVRHEIIDIDLPPSKQIFKRLIASREYKKAAIELLIRNAPAIIYTEGLDSLDIACSYKKTHSFCRIVYEVADLRESYIEEPRSFIARAECKAIKSRERKLFTSVDTLVVTSEKFYEMHYNKLIAKDDLVFLPNAPDSKAFESYKRKNSGSFTVGFIGGIRYINQMKMLVDAAERSDCSVLFAGIGFDQNEYDKIKDYCTGKENVRFTGRYAYDSEVATLYGETDCIFAVYNADNPNVKIALPNKLYEAVLCELPIIVAKGTYLAELVEKWGVGIPVSHTCTDELEQALQLLKEDSAYYEKIRAACREKKIEMDASIYHEKLKAVFSRILTDREVM